VLTGRGTFQKFYQQDKLKSYLEEQLGTDALPAAPGVNSFPNSRLGTHGGETPFSVRVLTAFRTTDPPRLSG